MYPPGDQNMTL